MGEVSISTPDRVYRASLYWVALRAHVEMMLGDLRKLT